MKALRIFFLIALSTTCIYGVADAKPQSLNAFGWFGKKADGGVKNLVNSWLSRHAPGKAGNEGEFRLPTTNTGPQPMVPFGNSGLVNNKQIPVFGQQAFEGGTGRMLPNEGAGGMLPNDQFLQPRQLGGYKGPALNRAGRR